ncbi:unnamed protein product [Chondrus crispus]|uniref:Putative restriction endonuclease domain-containing protein n=1 Tax=Chondrus crispus TaxID=2769 RepID=R7QCR3_CHOCR|nr:unnamed protein product [Chondrus crispus]CDF35543.1 unnamed protein product [Chondrus crispus]|eukprot:XP_005715362.1 unnamed protein product [Chondrus crispus]
MRSILSQKVGFNSNFVLLNNGRNMAFPSHNSDSAFPQPQSPNTLNSPTSPASATFADESDLFVQDEPHVGELHLVPCALDVYLDLPNKAEDRYELVEGILFHRPNMANTQHAIIKEFLVTKFRAVKLTGNNRVNIYPEMKVKVSSGKSRSPSVRVPDVVVGPYTSSESTGNASPRSQKIIFHEDNIPLMVIEITSPSNRLTDMNAKSEEYCRTGIATYVIIDRETDRVIVRKLIRNTRSRLDYDSEVVYTGDTLVDCFLFRERNLTAEKIFRPQQTAEEAAQSPTRREERAKERERRAKEEAQATAVSERRAKEAAQAKAKAAQARVDELERQLEEFKGGSTAKGGTHTNSVGKRG